MRPTPEFKKRGEAKQTQKIMQKPSAKMEALTSKKRNRLLSFWLYLLLVFNALTLLLSLFMSDSITKYFPTAPGGIVYAFSLLALFNVALVIFLFKWKLWAFWGFVSITLVNIVVSLIYGYGAKSFLSLLSPIILWLIMRPKWELFD